MKMPPDSPPPPCVGQHALFDSRRVEDHRVAKKLCDGCPVYTACWDNLQAVLRAPSDQGGTPEGTWAGKLFGKAQTTRERPECGTPRGYYHHYDHGEPSCKPCLAARAAEQRAREARRRDEVA